MWKTAKIVAANATVFVVLFLAVEMFLRFFMPAPPHGGYYLNENGEKERISKDSLTLKKNRRFTHISSEFSASITTNRFGYRKIKGGHDPGTLFIGDSFTFGHGIDDERTFSYLYCVDNRKSCMNLGYSGADSFQALDILEAALAEHGFQPMHVILVFLGACWIESSGNDLGGNILGAAKEERKRRGKNSETLKPVPENPPKKPAGSILKTIQGIVLPLQIYQRVMLVMGGAIKRNLYSCSPPEDVEKAVLATRKAFDRFLKIAAEGKFRPWVVLIHPSQEIGVMAYKKTEEILLRAARGKMRIIKTGARFNAKHYFPFDGHFNALGHANLAKILGGSLQ